MNETIVVENGQAAVATTSVSGTLSPASSATDTIVIVDTPAGKQAALKVFNLNGGGGGGGEVGGDYLPTTGGTGNGEYVFKRLLDNAYTVEKVIVFAPYTTSRELEKSSISVGNGFMRIGTNNYLTISGYSRYVNPDTDGNWKLGSSGYSWQNVYTKKLNNGADIAVPTEGGTLARIEDIDERIGDISIALTAILGE